MLHIAQILSLGTFPGGWEEVIIKLISAEAEAEAWLGLAELGNINFRTHKCVNNYLHKQCHGHCQNSFFLFGLKILHEYLLSKLFVINYSVIPSSSPQNILFSMFRNRL